MTDIKDMLLVNALNGSLVSRTADTRRWEMLKPGDLATIAALASRLLT